MPATKLVFVLNEIIKSEESYLNTLITLQREFIDPLQALVEKNPKLKENKDLQVFLKTAGNLKSIIDLSEQMLKEFKKARDTSSSDYNYATNIANVFEKHADFLKLHGQYIVSYNNITQLMPKIMKIKEIHELSNNFKLVTATEKGQGQGPLDSFILPVQRIPRYSLLLRDAIKETGKHEDKRISGGNFAQRLRAIVSKAESILTSTNASIPTADKKKTKFFSSPKQAFGYDTGGKVTFSWQDKTHSKTFNPANLKIESLQADLMQSFGFAAVPHRNHLNHKLYVTVTVKDPKTHEKKEIKFKIAKEKPEIEGDNQSFAIKIKEADLLSWAPGDRQRLYNIAEKIGKSVINATKTENTISFDKDKGVTVKDRNTRDTKILQKEDIIVHPVPKENRPKSSKK